MAFPSEAKKCQFDWKRFKSEKNGTKEYAAITKAAKSDPDSLPFTDKECRKMKPNLLKGPGRLLGSRTKEYQC
jgi:hypothetical protein